MIQLHAVCHAGTRNLIWNENVDYEVIFWKERKGVVFLSWAEVMGIESIKLQVNASLDRYWYTSSQNKDLKRFIKKGM